MTLQEAIVARHSVRAYTERPLGEDVVSILEENIGKLNKEGDLHIQLIRNEPKAFLGTLARYGRFRNVRNYLVMAGRKAENVQEGGNTCFDTPDSEQSRTKFTSDDLDERIGYYGEHLVLLAQTLGLNTCWVGLSYKKIPDTYVLEEREVIKAYIAIGYGETQGVGHKIKTVAQVSNATDITPSWFQSGVEAALLAPTAVNQQKFSFEYVGMTDNRHQVRAKKGFSLVGYTKIDLGIAKCHFEIGAGIENFDWI